MLTEINKSALLLVFIVQFFCKKPLAEKKMNQVENMEQAEDEMTSPDVP